MKAEHFVFLWDTTIDGRHIFNKLLSLHHRPGDASRAGIETIKSVDLSSKGPHILDITFHIYVPQRERLVWICQRQTNKPLQSDTCDLMRKVRNIFPDATEADRIFKDRFGFSLTLRESNMWEMFVEFMFCHILSKRVYGLSLTAWVSVEMEMSVAFPFLGLKSLCLNLLPGEMFYSG